MTDHATTARTVIDANRYMTLATLNPDGSPRVSPVYYTAARYQDLYWVSEPGAQHSQNIAARPQIELVIFDSSLPPGESDAVYIGATAEQVSDDQLGRVLPEAFDPSRGGRAFTKDELTGDGDLRLYVAHVTRTQVHVPGRRHPSGIDKRETV